MLLDVPVLFFNVVLACRLEERRLLYGSLKKKERNHAEHDRPQDLEIQWDSGNR